MEGENQPESSGADDDLGVTGGMMELSVEPQNLFGHDQNEIPNADIAAADPSNEIMGEIILPGVNDLPEFANLEAKKIHRENIAAEQEIEKIVVAIDDMKERVKVMKEHFKNVNQEVEHTNALQGAKNNEIKTELHLRQLTSRALGRGQNESKKIQTDIEFMKGNVTD